MVAVIVFAALSVATIGSRVFFNKISSNTGFLLKSAASLLFCVAAFIAVVAAVGKPDSGLRVLLLASLCLGALGDILLAQTHIVKEESLGATNAIGGVAFLTGHILFIIVFLNISKLNPYLIPIAVIPFVLYFILWKAKLLNLGKNALPVFAYSIVLGLMLMGSANVLAAGLEIGRFVLPAAILFVVSDTSLFVRNYTVINGKKMDDFRNLVTLTVMLPYYTAQALFAITILLL